MAWAFTRIMWLMVFGDTSGSVDEVNGPRFFSVYTFCKNEDLFVHLFILVLCMEKCSIYKKMIDVVEMRNAFVSFNGRNILDFPLHVPMGMPLVSFLKDTFKKYCILLEFVQKNSNLKSDISVAKVQGLCDGIISVMERYCQGKTVTAYTDFKNKVMKEIFSDIPTIELQNESFYRMRNIKGLHRKSDFFPLPLNLRHLAGGQRFSLPGYSCLYLGYSKEVCKKEVGNDGSVIEVSVKDGKVFKLLDLTFNDEDQDKFIKVWPLIAACYIVPFYCMRSKHVCKPETINFHEEYIIPQFLTCYIREEQPALSGIRYYTVQDTKLNPLNNEMKNVILFGNGTNVSSYDEFVDCFNWGNIYAC